MHVFKEQKKHQVVWINGMAGGVKLGLAHTRGLRSWWGESVDSGGNLNTMVIGLGNYWPNVNNRAYLQYIMPGIIGYTVKLQRIRSLYI